MLHFALSVVLMVLLMTATSLAEPPRLRPDRPDAVYRAGQTIGFSVVLPEGTEPADWRYTVRADNAREIESKPLERVDGRVRIEFTFGEPSILRIEVVPADAPTDQSRRAVAAAAVDPDQLKPVAPEPADFDAFWTDQLHRMRDIPLNAQITLDDQTDQGVLYQQFRLDHVRNSSVHGQLARPARDGRFPALISYQWAGAPYPLERAWVKDPARQGWLALNIQAHDALSSAPQSYYDQLPESIRKYERVGLGDLETTFLVEMYLRTVRVIDYLATRNDWDGKTLVVSGTSMGGMQAIVAAALDRRVTHLLVCEPAGCDLLAGLHGRQTGYPYLPTDDPNVVATLGYLDVIHFAPRVRVPALVGVGFLDTSTPPTGIWTMFNQLAGPRELVPMPDAAHNHISTPQQLAPFTRRNTAWLDAIVNGQTP